MSTNTDTEINEAVAIKLGARKIECRGPHDYYCDHWELTHGVGLSQRKFARNVPNYCHSIEAAWEVVESMGIGWTFKLHHRIDWNAEFFHDEVTRNASDKRYATTSADTAPMAIALCFLKLP